MDEAERLCDELVIMDAGRIIAQGAPADLVRKHVGEEVVELRVTEEREAEVLAGLELSGVETERAGDVRLYFVGRKSAAGDAIVQRAQERRVPSFLRSATLEDVFLRLTGRELSE
jgi:lipooligosaccharide transport system ATP-binding protein